MSNEPRRVLIKSAGQDCDYEIARRFIKSGAKVTIFGSSSRAEPKCECISSNFSNKQSIDDVIGIIEIKKPHVFINGIENVTRNSLEDLTAQKLEAALVENTIAPLLLSNAAARVMRENGFGRIVNLVSTWTAVAVDSSGLLSISHAALESGTASLANEFAGSGVLANSVAVPMRAATQASSDSAPFEGIAELVHWLCTENTTVSGQQVYADHGMARFC